MDLQEAISPPRRNDGYVIKRDQGRFMSRATTVYRGHSIEIYISMEQSSCNLVARNDIASCKPGCLHIYENCCTSNKPMASLSTSHVALYDNRVKFYFKMYHTSQVKMNLI